MAPTNSRNEIAEIGDGFEAAVQRERGLARQIQSLLHNLGLAHNAEVRLSSQLRNGSESLNVASADTDELLNAYTARKQALDHQQAMIGTLTSALDRARADKKQAAEQVAEHYGSLVKQAHATFKARFGKTPSRFAFWKDANEAEMAWRVVVVNQLLYQVQTRVPGSLAAVRLLLSGEPFRLRVMRGFFLEHDGEMKAIRPTPDGVTYQVPQNIFPRDAFEAVLTGRAELVAGA
jgi:hypothetical protein